MSTSALQHAPVSWRKGWGITFTFTALYMALLFSAAVMSNQVSYWRRDLRDAKVSLLRHALAFGSSLTTDLILLFRMQGNLSVPGLQNSIR